MEETAGLRTAGLVRTGRDACTVVDAASCGLGEMTVNDNDSELKRLLHLGYNQFPDVVDFLAKLPLAL